jgi:hypothetical protein
MKKEKTAELRITCFEDQQCKIELGGEHEELASALHSLIEQGDEDNPVYKILMAVFINLNLEKLIAGNREDDNNII